MNRRKTFRTLIACVALMACQGMVAAQENSSSPGVKEDARAAGKKVGDAGRDVGHATKDAAVSVGHGAKDMGVAVGHGTRDAAVTVGHGARDGWNATKNAVKHAFGKDD